MNLKAEITVDDILKAMKLCACVPECSWCPYYDPNKLHKDKCHERRNRDFEYYISNLQDTNEALIAELERFKKIETTVNAFWSELQKITTFKKKSKPTLEELLEYMENLKDEVAKEFAVKLKSKAYLENGVTGFQEMVVDVRDIDETYDEMVGDTK